MSSQCHRHLLLVGLLLPWSGLVLGAAPDGTTAPALCDSKVPIRDQPAAPPARLRCLPDADVGGTLRLVIPGLEPIALTGVDGGAPLDGHTPMAPPDLTLTWLPGPPPRYWLRYRQSRHEAASAEAVHQRDLVFSAIDSRQIQFDEWSEPYDRSDRQGLLWAAERELTLSPAGSGLRVLTRAAHVTGWWGLVDGQLGAAWSCGNDCGEQVSDDSPLPACVRECLRALLHDDNQEQTLEVRQRTLDADGRTSADRRAWARLYSPLTFAFAPRPGEQPLDLLVLDDGTAGWLLIPREPPDLGLAGGFDPAAPGPIPATNACWLYNHRPWQPADADRPWPPAPAELVRVDHGVPAACCTVDTSRDGRSVLVWSTRPEDDPGTSATEAPPPRLLALYDRGTNQCWSLNLARSGALGQAPYDRLGDPVFSPDGRRLAFRAQRGEARFVVVDGQPGAPYHRVSGPVFSPDNGHLAYWARDRGKEFVVLDGTPGPAFHGVGLPVFAPNGRLAYRFSDGQRWRVMVGTEPGPAFDDIGVVQVDGTGRVNDLADLVFSSTGTLAYAARRGADWFLVRDQRPGQPYRQVGLPVFSTDGARLAFRAARGGREFVVVDDRPGPDYDFVGTPVFGPNGRDLAYWASVSGRELIVWNERECPAATAPARVGAPVFANSGDAPYYLVEEGDGLWTRRGRIWRGMQPVTDTDFGFDPVLNRVTDELAWWEHDTSMRRAVHAGRPGPGFHGDSPRRHPLMFSPDGHLLAYGASRNGRELVRVGEQDGSAFDEVGDPVFSPTGDRLAYRARVGSVWVPVVGALSPTTAADDRAGPPTAAPSPASASLTHVVPRRLPHPVAVDPGVDDAALILGGSAGGHWLGTAALVAGHALEAFEASEQGKGCVPVSPEWLEPGLRWRLYGPDRTLGECAGARVAACLAASGAVQVELKLPDCPIKGWRTAIAGAWDALPRRPRLHKDPGRFAPLIRQVLDAHGLSQAPVRILRVHGIDLDGDGQEELVIRAANGNGEGPVRADTDYSLLLLVPPGAGAVPAVIRAWWPAADGSPFERYDAWFADADGDGVMEIFVDWQSDEGSAPMHATDVYTLRGGQPVATPLAWAQVW